MAIGNASLNRIVICYWWYFDEYWDTDIDYAWLQSLVKLSDKKL